MLAPLLAAATPAAAQIGYSGSVTFVRSRATDGVRSDAVYVFNGVDVPIGPVRASVTVPWIAQQTLLFTDASTTAAGSQWVRGLGDVFVRAEVPITRRLSPVSAAVSGAVKFPTADADRGLGSGEVDVTFGVTDSATRGRHLVLTDVSYWMLGDSPELEVRSVPALYVGYGVVLGREYRWTATVAVASSVSIVEGYAAPTQLSVGVLRVMRSGAALGMNIGIGLTDTTAAFTVGTSWRLVF